LRVSIKDIPLVDKELESQYHVILFKYLFDHETKGKIIVKPLKDKIQNKEEEWEKNGVA
jgi:hypothetical protein